MRLTGNTILITGGGSGIGRALAEAFHKLGNTVIIAGRRQGALDAVALANPGMKTAVLDVSNHDDIKRFAVRAAREFPSLNVLVNNAGIMQPEDWCVEAIDVSIAEATVVTNLLAPIRLAAALLPQLRKQPRATIMNVSSGLAFLPLALTPTYSATKSAVHTFSDALRYQLRGSAVDVVELVPPYVQTGLMGEQQHSDPHAMPLAGFIDEVMGILKAQPDVTEILVERVLPLRQAAEQGRETFQERFRNFNDAFVAPEG